MKTIKYKLEFLSHPIYDGVNSLTILNPYNKVVSLVDTHFDVGAVETPSFIKWLEEHLSQCTAKFGGKDFVLNGDKVIELK